MNLYPTRQAAHLALAGVAVVATGVVAREPAILGWGAGILLAVAVARAVTLVSVSRIRAAGFEMLWTGPARVVRAARGGKVSIQAEVRNRDTLAARFVKLRVVASPSMHVKIEPSSGEVPASGRLLVSVEVETPRVGQHGVHGLALEVRGAPGIFEVPLTFANPYGVEVLPQPLAAYLMQPRGGRSRLTAAAGRPGRARGEGSDLRELREHQPGDAFRRIAWKASARRGQLLVRDFEREERDVVWLVLDVSVDLWAGPLGRAPLDLAIDDVAGLASRHLGRGDRVGLYLFASAPRVVLPPDTGPAHAAKLTHALVVGAGTYDADRSDLDEADVAVRVLEHLRPLDPKNLADVRRGDLDKLAARADALRARAPFAAAAPEARALRERTLRRYLAAYGIDSPPRTEPDRPRAAAALASALAHVTRARPRPSRVHVVAPPPDVGASAPAIDAARRLVRAGVLVTWTTPELSAALAPPWDPPPPPSDPDDLAAAPLEPPPAHPPELESAVAADAVLARAHIAAARGEGALRKAGVKVLRTRRAPLRALAFPGRPDPESAS
jgi:uncharacterized protein (DUF58 family)